MLPATSALKAYIAANRDAVPADLYTFAPATGSTLRFTSYPVPLTVAATGFPDPHSLNHGTSGNRAFLVGPGFGRSKVARKIGTDATELDIVVQPKPTDLIGALTWQQFINLGGLDDATVELDRLLLPAGTSAAFPDTSLGAVTWFYGQVAEIETGRSGVQIKVKSLLNLLTIQQMPRHVYQSACNYVFGDAMCGYDRVAGKNALGVSTGAGAIAVTAITGSGQSNILVGSGVASYYGLGSCIGLTGANAGVARSIISVAIPTNVGLQRPFPYAVAIGDTFQLLPGCDKTLNTCIHTFNNGAPDGGRFGGMPYIPPPEDAM